jgi:hypothetical protein
VFAYSNGSYSDAEDDDPAELSVRFPNAITSAKAIDQYRLDFLTAGTYDIVIAAYNNDAFGEVLGFVHDVVVESEHVTTQTIDTDALESTP